jgi:deuterolysin
MFYHRSHQSTNPPLPPPIHPKLVVTMFRVAALLSFATLALALSAGDLKVSVTPVSTSVASIEDIVLTAVVSNPTDKDIRVIAANNILDGDQPTRSFGVSKDGKAVPFTGALVAPDLSVEANWVTIPAGQSVAVNHTVSELYHFESAGTGEYTFSTPGIFQTGPSDDALVVSVPDVKVTVTHDVARRHLLKRKPAQSTPACGDANRQRVLVDSLASARSLAGGAASDIRNHPNSDIWNKFFGGNSQDDIWYRFDIIAGDLASSGVRQIHCNTDPANICSRATAYTYIYYDGSGHITSSDIYPCEGFWGLQTTPNVCRQNIGDINNSLGGVLLHEVRLPSAWFWLFF